MIKDIIPFQDYNETFDAFMDELHNDIHTLFVPIKPTPKNEPCFTISQTRQIVLGEEDVYIRPCAAKKKDLVYFDEYQFVNTAKNKWVKVNSSKAREMLQEVSLEVNRLWKLKREDVLLYPELYNKCGHISLTIDEMNSLGITFERVNILKANRWQPRIKFLSVKSENPVKMHYPNKANNYQVLPMTLLKGKPSNPIVSRDKVAGDLAIEKDVDVVISRSGLKTLVDNHTSIRNSDWMLPFCIKEVTRSDGTKKRVLFVDKALPHQCMSNMEQKDWHGKKATNSFMFLNKVKFSDLMRDDENLRNVKSEKDVFGSTKRRTISDKTNMVKTFYSYELWKLEELGEKKILLKNAKRNMKILVRNKKPAEMELNPGSYCVSSKLEYQQEFGGEHVPLSQLTREWMSLLLNPQGHLVRVRADANTLKYSRLDMNEIVSTDKNIQHLYNVQIKNQLYIVYNVLNYLVGLQQGQYLLCRNPNDGAFASVLKAAESKGSFNLYEHFTALKMKEENTAWTPIDLALITPKLRINKSQQQSDLSTPMKTTNQKNKTKKRKKKRRNKQGLKNY